MLHPSYSLSISYLDPKTLFEGIEKEDGSCTMLHTPIISKMPDLKIFFLEAINEKAIDKNRKEFKSIILRNINNHNF